MFYRQLKCFLVALCLISTSLLAKTEYFVETQPIAMEQALNLPTQGVLKQKVNGMIYLDIDNAYITSLVPLLECPGELRPLTTTGQALGAYITVFDEKEQMTPEELNASFDFSIKEICSLTLQTPDGLRKQWVITVASPELELLRAKYGLDPKLGEDFHIILGKMMPFAPEGWQAINDLSIYNFSLENTAPLATRGDFTPLQHSEILATAAKVNALGQLHLRGNGFVYLDVDNSYIDSIVSQLPINGEFVAIPTKAQQMGAHISVIYEDEMIQKEIWHLVDAGYWFAFEVKELRYIDRKTAQGVNRLWILAADAPALQRLRISYGLKAKLQGHDFHITLGTEKIASHAIVPAKNVALEIERESFLPLAG